MLRSLCIAFLLLSSSASFASSSPRKNFADSPISSSVHFSLVFAAATFGFLPNHLILCKFSYWFSRLLSCCCFTHFFLGFARDRTIHLSLMFCFVANFVFVFCGSFSYCFPLHLPSSSNLRGEFYVSLRYSFVAFASFSSFSLPIICTRTHRGIHVFSHDIKARRVTTTRRIEFSHAQIHRYVSELVSINVVRARGF